MSNLSCNFALTWFSHHPQRGMAVEAIAHQGDHINTEEVFAQIQEHTRTVNIATVYRTLELLV